jgi:hypothetical protein
MVRSLPVHGEKAKAKAKAPQSRRLQRLAKQGQMKTKQQGGAAPSAGSSCPKKSGRPAIAMSFLDEIKGKSRSKMNQHLRVSGSGSGVGGGGFLAELGAKVPRKE